MFDDAVGQLSIPASSASLSVCKFCVTLLAGSLSHCLFISRMMALRIEFSIELSIIGFYYIFLRNYLDIIDYYSLITEVTTTASCMIKMTYYLDLLRIEPYSDKQTMFICFISLIKQDTPMALQGFKARNTCRACQAPVLEGCTLL